MTDNKPQRWCIYVDILGFSKLWETEQMKALQSLRALMQAIYRIGSRVYPHEGERLFVHHMGDGFAIVSDFSGSSLERPIVIAIALMRCVAATGTFAAAAIAEGDFADITGCYPAEVTTDLDDAHVIRLGAGLMTLSSVMGTAFIRAYRLNSDSPPGPFLVLSDRHHDQIPSSFSVRRTRSRKGSHLLSIDWMRGDPELLVKIQQRAGLSAPTADAIVQAIQTYCVEYGTISATWRDPVRELLNVNLLGGGTK